MFGFSDRHMSQFKIGQRAGGYHVAVGDDARGMATDEGADHPARHAARGGLGAAMGVKLATQGAESP